MFVGNLDPVKLQPLVETYLGSLPSAGKKQTWKDVGVRYATGKVTKQIVQGSEPKSYVSLSFGGPETWSRDVARDARVLAMVLQIRLREVLREDHRRRVWRALVGLALAPADGPPRGDDLASAAIPPTSRSCATRRSAWSAQIQQEGIPADYLAKVTEQLKRARETDAKENWWWVSQLREAYWHGEPFAAVTDLDGVLARATSARVQAAARRFFDEKHLVVGVLRPAPTAGAAAAPAPAP